MTCPPETVPSPRRPLWRTIVFSLLPLFVSLTLLEVTLRLTGIADLEIQSSSEPPPSFNPHAYIWPRDRALGPWFRVSPHGEVETNQVLVQRSMYQLRFPREKDEGELRLFALGGSTTQGGYSGVQDGGFPKCLEEELRRRAPHRAWRVLNTGVGGMDSNAFPGLAKEILHLNPDGLIIYAGNNELRGRLIQVCSGTDSAAPLSWFRRLAIVRVGRALLQRRTRRQPLDPRRILVEQDECMRKVVLRQHGEQVRKGTGKADEGIPGDEPWFPAWPERTDGLYLDTLHQFERNLVQVLDLARERGVQVWLAVPPLNYQVPPTLPLFRPDLSRSRQRVLTEKLAEAERLIDTGQNDGAVAILDAFLDEDPTHAGACYKRGMLALEGRDVGLAHLLLRRANDRDFVGGRITSHMQEILRGLCQDRPELRCPDIQGAFEEAASGSLPGPELFEDFCHPTFGLGVRVIVDTLVAAVLEWEAEVP